MKKINLILIIILLTSSLSSNSQFTVSSGTTVTWNSPLTIYGNIYIEDGGKLMVNTDLTLLPNVRIYVHNGGILEGTNGSFVKHPSSSMANWGGVYVEGTNEIGGSIGTNAIDLENFLISGAKIAIYTYDYELGVSPITTNVVQQIQCKNVTFLNNDRHLLVENYGAYAINETSPNEFVGCTFGAATSSWPIMMFSPDGFSFRNSEFDYDSPFAQRAIHCDYPANLELINNEFYDVGWAAIGLHYTVENVTIHSNYFSTETQYSIIQDFDYAYTAIELGAEVPTTLKNITLSNNFIGDFSSVNTDNYVGIVMRNATGEDINITGNTMTGIGTGIDVKNMSLGNNLIRSNTISEGDYGVVASGGNQALYIQCNKFINLKEGITIKNSTLQNHTFGLDPNNQFTNILNYDIANYGSVPFTYNVNLSTPWTNPSTFYGTVFTSFVSSNECQITSPPRRSPSNDENVEKKESNLSVYPNPTNGSVKILLTDFEEKAQIYLYETSGKLIYTSEFLEENFTLDLSNYENGIYQLIISSGEQIFRRKILLNK